MHVQPYIHRDEGCIVPAVSLCTTNSTRNPHVRIRIHARSELYHRLLPALRSLQLLQLADKILTEHQLHVRAKGRES